MNSRAWLGLQLGVLGLAGVMALLVGLARTPALSAYVSETYFYVALVGHVDLLNVVWYLVMPVLLWRYLGLLGGRPERLAFWIMTLGILVFAVPAVAGLGREVHQANYVPFLIHPLFIGGLALFFTGVGVAAAQAVRWGRLTPSPLARAGGAAALCVLGSLASMLILAIRLGPGGGALQEQNLAGIFWVGGHLLQFAHAAVMLTIWGLLLNGLGAQGPGLGRFLGFIRWYPLGVAVGLAATITLDPAVLVSSRLMTLLKGWGVGVPTALAVLLALPMWWSTRRVRGIEGAWSAAVGSGMLLLATGGGIALFGSLSRQTTLIPSHYHAVLTAVALAFMGLTYFILTREDIPLPSWRWAVWQPWFYGLGTLALVAGMAWAGIHGAPRKTPDPSVAGNAAFLWGLGALLSVAGGGAYLLYVGRALKR